MFLFSSGARNRLFVAPFKRVIKYRHEFPRCYWNVSVDKNEQTIRLKKGENGESLIFPTVWLRDNCQCSACFNRNVNSRTIPFTEFHSELLPVSASYIKADSGESKLQVRWHDQHESEFQIPWLSERSFEKEKQQKWIKNNEKLTTTTTWTNNEFGKYLKYFNYQDIMSNDSDLLRWLLTLKEYGVAIVKDMGTNRNEVEKLADRIGYSKRTTYGSVYVVENKPNTTNSAYLSTPLNLHVDLPYFEYIPSVNLLHFAVQSKHEGEGVNYLVDGFEVCKQLKNQNAELYETLARILVEWTDVGSDNVDKFHHVHRAPVICENVNGEIYRLNLSQPQRDSQFCVSIDEAKQWYKSMHTFLQLAHSPDNFVNFKMEEGNLLSFDNRRVLHGRSGFTTSRSVIGAYMDWDIIDSKIRICCNNLNIKDLNEL